MFTAMRNPAQAYRSVGVETSVAAADPHKLILMLYDGAMVSISSARLGLERSDPAAAGAAISKAIDIIANGLKVSLDLDAGGALAARLAALYDYMAARLLHANLKRDTCAMDEVSHLLKELKGAWEQIRAAGDPALTQAA